MLESVLADVLTRVLGQYLQGIDRDSVHFGAWNGLIELRGVALRPEALAVLFETLGMALPVTVEAGFIGLLRLVVPWNAIGTTPVQIHMHDVTIIARPIRGDGSDDSQLRIRDRRIKRAKLNTDDAVREASWGVANDQNDESSTSSWSSWLVSDQLRATIIENIQIHLSDINIRFEDPFSDPKTPYIASIICASLKAVSANHQWKEAFVERRQHTDTRKLLEVKGFQIDWAPITTCAKPTPSSSSSSSVDPTPHFQTAELLKQFLNAAASLDSSVNDAAAKSLLHPVDGFMRMRLSATPATPSFEDFRQQQPSVDLDIRFPDVVVDLHDAQYACLLQTSVYFARLATRGFRPSTPKARWQWAVDQLLPGFCARYKRMMRFTEKGLLETHHQRDMYFGYRLAVLKARRTGVEEPKDIAVALERMEDDIDFDEILAYRDAADRCAEQDAEKWAMLKKKVEPPPTGNEGTTMSSFWSMLGYSGSSAPDSSTIENPAKTEGEVLVEAETAKVIPSDNTDLARGSQSSVPPFTEPSRSRKSLVLRAAFLLRNASIRIAEGGFPNTAIPRVSLTLRDLQAGVMYSSAKDLIAEAVLGSIEAWDMQKQCRMVYSRHSAMDHFQTTVNTSDPESMYPWNVSEAIEGIRSGSNPARDVLYEEGTYSDEDELMDSSSTFFSDVRDSLRDPAMSDDGLASPRRPSRSRDSSPPATFRVTDSEFLGNPKYSGVQKYIAAFRYSQSYPENTESSTRSVNSLDISVATLEAVIDGPKGSFLWGFKFWQPKGLAQDPIMAFLGAAAGVRIAELRMEMEEALLANSVPMQLNAVILAPRFIIPSSSESAPAFVINMGTLGIITSDGTPTEASTETQKHLRYSNYILTLDDLGMYFSPNLTTAVSRSLQAQGPDLPAENELISTQPPPVDTTDVERIIRPFSLRFVLQTLRDSNVVQVAQGSSSNIADGNGDAIAKVRIRGTIPGLSLILTQKAFQHLLVTLRTWSEELRPSSLEATTHSWQDGSTSEPNQNGDGHLFFQPSRGSSEISKFPEQESGSDNKSAWESQPYALASYNVKVVVQSVSVELRESVTVRLVTAVASRLSASLVKMSKTNLHADVSLQSWSVTDGSRGSTAAFRRLLYAGTFSGPEGVSPPRYPASHDGLAQDTNFVNIHYTLDFAANEQKIKFRFLSLNVVCVRETYLKLISFFDRVRRYARNRRRSQRVRNLALSGQNVRTTLEPSHPGPSVNTSNEPSSSRISGGRMTVVSEFDGFNCQLVASGGVVAVYEMRGSRINYLRERDGSRTAKGDFSQLFVRDMTAPLREHISVISYEKSNVESNVMDNSTRSDGQLCNDGWELQFPQTQGGYFFFKGCFRGIHTLFLNRFSEVLRQYFSVLANRLNPAFSSMMDDEGGELGGVSRLSDVSQQSVPSSTPFRVDFILRNVDLRVPRHSSYSSEAITVSVSKVNVFKDQTASAWKIFLHGLNCAVLYSLPTSSADEYIPIASTFLNQKRAEIEIHAEGVAVQDNNRNLGDVTKAASLHFPDRMHICLSEAQYTVLYFVMTENFTETISGDEIATHLDPGQASSDFEAFSDALVQDADVSIDGIEDRLFNITNSAASASRAGVATFTRKLDISIPVLSFELSRGWDVNDTSCKILGAYVSDVEMKIQMSTPKRIIFELEGNLLSVADMRFESRTDRKNFVVALSSNSQESSTPLQSPSSSSPERGENVSLSYEKVGTDRPTIIVFLSKFQLELIPELFRDLMCLAIPGWPFLTTSPFAPDYVYVGRILTVVLNESQVFLANESERERGALVFTGEFETKMEWMRGTGAKTISLRSNQLEISAVNDVSLLHASPEMVSSGLTRYAVPPFKRIQAPLLYPTDSFVEYVGPNVDENGCRLNVSVDAALCLVCASDVPIINAIFHRLGSLEDSYLSRREWSQLSKDPEHGPSPRLETPKQEHTRKARESVNLSLKVPASRFLVTDDSFGRFVPVLEVKQSGFSVSAHGSSMVQVAGQLSADLFNPTNGWWEPALEPWTLTASMSRGQSGSRAFVVRSEERMNVTITPTTVTAVLTVARALKKATTSSSKADKSEETTSSRNVLHLEELSDPKAHRPTVAAFMLKNQLGIPLLMSIPGNSKWTSVAHMAEVEVGAESEHLLSSSSSKGHRSRELALRCSISVSPYAPQDFSAAEVGRHPIALIPQDKPAASIDEYQMDPVGQGVPLLALWEVQMRNGVPACTLRSRFRVVNNTQTKLDVIIIPGGRNLFKGFQSREVHSLEPGENFPLPVMQMNGAVHVRPSVTSTSMSDGNSHAYGWSSGLPNLSWLMKMAHERRLYDGPNPVENPFNKSMSTAPIVACKHLDGQGDFFLKVIPQMASPLNSKWKGLSPWLDITLRAPIVLKNKLPGILSYRIRQRNVMPSVPNSRAQGQQGLDLTAGTINPLDEGHLHFTGESLHSSFISLAFENLPRSISEYPSKFGPSLRLDDLESGRVKAVQPNLKEGESSRGGIRKEFRASVLAIGNSVSQFNFFANFWLRNRSDTAVEVCSRSNFYGAATSHLLLRDRPPHFDPDQYVCFEGPYLSVRLPSRGLPGDEDVNEHSNWWTSTSSLEDLEKPMPITLPGRSLELDVRPAVGLDCNTFIVTIRNTSWIINDTASMLQWCQKSALDAHGNCPTRLLHSLRSGDSQGLHWDSKSAKQEVHLRLADEYGGSEWIWSPAIPLNIGHSRELPAKMYRPKTHDQYIARVASKEIAGLSRALIVYPEDRQNPPYRIVNLCSNRAIAFSQVGSQERPWLVRAGKTTRYSWDNPLAPPSERLLTIRILEKEDLLPTLPSTGSSSQRPRPVRYPPKTLSIDKVGERVMVMSEIKHPPVVFNVTVDGATKIVTLFDEGSLETVIPRVSLDPKTPERESLSGSSVPVVGWDDLGPRERSRESPIPIRLASGSSMSTFHDYPSTTGPRTSIPKPMADNPLSASGTDAVIFLNSIGVSVVDGSPSEIIYFSSSGLLLNYESSGKVQSVALHVKSFQIDNQLTKTPYPVLLWVPNTPQPALVEGGPLEETPELNNAVSIEVHRDIINDDILMIRSFQAFIRPFNIYFEEGLVTKVLQFINEASDMGGGKRLENLSGMDDEQRAFVRLGVTSSENKRLHDDGSSSSRRIYMHDFRVGPTSIRLTSTGSGAAIAKAAGLGSSSRTIVGLLLNVENCDFDFQALIVENVFDSLHHFAVLAQKYYIAQVDQQRIKLLASNSLMGNPAALFDAVGTGARDFLAEPGRAKSSAEFIASVGRGSKSLLTHTVGGLGEYVSSIPRAVSTGLERAVGDNDYLAERERIRGSNLAGGHRGSAAKNTAQGLATGALSFAHGISSGVTGLIREPVQGARQGGAGGLLKGIGKAFIGGLAKPVAGAIDLVAEPAAGLSRQIAETDRNASGITSPVRPPRAFRGKNPRLERYDRRYSTGTWLFKAVALLTGNTFSSELVDWVELSNRPERSSDDGDIWVWDIVQRYSRNMPGAKRQARKQARTQGIQTTAEARPEKTRVALVTEDEIVIATLDCKLVTVIALWRDARYELASDSESLLIRCTIIGGQVELGASGFLQGLSGAQSLIAAPWDAATPVRRRKPAVGESVLERIACASLSARDDLRSVVAEVTRRHGDRSVIRRKRSSVDPGSSGQELATVGKWRTGPPDPPRRRAREEQERDGLVRAIRKLASVPVRGVARVVVVNRLPDGFDLNVEKAGLEVGSWRGDAPVNVPSRQARAFEVNSGPNGEAAGCVVFQAVDRRSSDVKMGQVALDIFCGRDSAASFTTRVASTVVASCERWRGGGGAVVLSVRAGEGFGRRSGESESGEVEDGESADQGGNAEGTGASVRNDVQEARESRDVGNGAEMSADEKLLKQLVEIGFKFEDAVTALADAGGDLVRAVDILTSRQQS